MNINPIGFPSSSPSTGAPTAGGDSQIKALEQKLSQLNKEMEKAKKAKKLDEIQKLKQQIQKIERQLEELKNRQSNNEKEMEKEASSTSWKLCR